MIRYSIKRKLNDRGITDTEIYKYKLKHPRAYDKIEKQVSKIVVDKLYQAIKHNRHIQVNYCNEELFI